MEIDLRTPLTLRASFAFPLQSPVARRELLWGALLLVALPGLGWVLNMGHRVAFVRRMQHGRPPFPAWREEGRPWPEVYAGLLRDGAVTCLGMVWFHAPGAAALLALGAALWLGGTALAPAFMAQ